MFGHPVTYCSNIHPGESWQEITAALRRHAPDVKRVVSPDAAFPLGLRLSGRASEEAGPQEAEAFGRWLEQEGFYIATLNGFPYGPFHGRPVKEAVYQPDWRDPERAAYTLRLAELLSGWLPPAMVGSISSVPLAFGRRLEDEDFRLCRANILDALDGLSRLHEERGKLLLLSLEPEPGCYLERTADVVALFERLDLPQRLLPHLACCYDCCHQALQFESPEESLRLLDDHGIPIGHVQVSSALHLEGDNLDCLRRFDESVYLHQAVARTPQGLKRYDDLPPALQEGAAAQAWRVHFHLPVFLDALPECRTTQDFLLQALPLFAPQTPLEVETYTWDVLPPELRSETVTDSIAREILWVEQARRGKA